MISNKKNFIKRSIFILFGIFLTSACVVPPPPPTSSAPINLTPSVTCSLPDGYNLDAAIEESVETVKNCPDMWEDIFVQLLKIASNKPSPKNRDKIRLNYLKVLSDKYIISEIKAKKAFNQYLSKTMFYSVPSDKVFYVCKHIDKVFKNIDSELDKKRLGVAGAMGDANTYNKIKEDFSTFKVSLSLACEE